MRYKSFSVAAGKLVLLVSILAAVVSMVTVRPAFMLGEPLLKIGSRGEQVVEAQSRLRYLGYYTGAIDGQYGWRTYRAVRWFQHEFGLEMIDGIVGPKTGAMLVQASPGWSGRISTEVPGASSAFSDNDIRLMAMAVHGEARGEPYIGQVAVAAVIINRIESDQFPNTVADVLFEPLAFTAVADGQFWLEPDESAFKAVRDAVNGWDPSLGALFYFNPDTATSAWIWSRPQIKRIGKHIFCA